MQGKSSFQMAHNLIRQRDVVWTHQWEQLSQNAPALNFNNKQRDEQLSDLSGVFLINHCLGPMEPIPELESSVRIAIVAVMCMTSAMLLCYKSAAS